MENNNEMIDPKMVENIVKESFGITDKIPAKITISYDDLLRYTRFIVETVLKSSIIKTDKLLEEQRKINNTINYN